MKATAARPGGAIDARADGTSVTLPHDLTPRILIDAYRWMLLSRRIDDKEIQLKNQSHIYFQISGAGHEAILVASAMHTRGGYDWFCPYYRDRALCLVLGVTPLDMFLQAVGAKDDPASRGRQMPSHWGSPLLHIVSQGSPTGTQALQAVGLAEASQLYQRITDIPDRATHFHPDDVVYCSIGDGATSEGEFWESLNTSSQKRLPVVFVVEDNGYAISVPVEVQTPGGNIARLVQAFPHLKVIEVDGTDFVASYGALGEAVAWARARSGPALVHARVTRPYSHSLSDDERFYKTPEEREEEAKRDPVPLLARLLLEAGFVTDDDLADMSASVDREVQEAVDRALTATRPGKETAALWVYSPDVDPAGAQFEGTPDTSGKPDTMVSAINRTLHDEMRVNPRMVVFGQDVADCSREETLPRVSGKGGVFKVTHGLQKAFGSTRVYNSPLAEANIVGRAFGLAVRGLKPVVEIQFFDYIWPAMMQIRDEITMLRYRSGNGFSCPMVIRVPIGGYLRGGAPYHSQSGESIFAHCPGIRIAYPSNAQDAAGLLRTSIRCDDPVLFLEHKHLLPADVQQGAVSGCGLHRALRTRGVAPCRRGCPGDHLGRPGAAHAAGGAAGGARRALGGRAGSADDHPLRLAHHQRARPEVQPGHRRTRGSVDVRIRCRDLRADRRRAISLAGCADSSCRCARHAGSLRPGPRRGNPAPVLGCLGRDTRDRKVIEIRPMTNVD